MYKEPFGCNVNKHTKHQQPPHQPYSQNLQSGSLLVHHKFTYQDPHA